MNLAARSLVVGSDSSADPRVWDREYRSVQAIPSSTRELPAHALLLFSEFLRVSEGTRVVDLGCGNGRNAVYLAEKGARVTAVDSSAIALERLQELMKRRRSEHRIEVVGASLSRAFPFESAAFDLALDAYVSCHFVDEHTKAHFLKETHRVLRRGGQVFSCLLSPDDEYYSPLIRRTSAGRLLGTDPHNGVTKEFYTDEQLRTLFSRWFRVLYLARLEFEDEVIGRIYRRSVVALLMEKP